MSEFKKYSKVIIIIIIKSELKMMMLRTWVKFVFVYLLLLVLFCLGLFCCPSLKFSIEWHLSKYFHRPKRLFHFVLRFQLDLFIYFCKNEKFKCLRANFWDKLCATIKWIFGKWTIITVSGFGLLFSLFIITSWPNFYELNKWTLNFK